MPEYRAKHRGHDYDFVPFHLEKSYSGVSRQNRGIRSSVPQHGAEYRLRASGRCKISKPLE